MIMDKKKLVALLVDPKETPSAEYKSWLNLSGRRDRERDRERDRDRDRDHDRATLAKAAIALANHGGGVIVLGMREDKEDGGALYSTPFPEVLKRYAQDDINNAVNRYADPQLHCDLSFVGHPKTGVEHAIIGVPVDTQVPVMTLKGRKGVINAMRCYVRKPGPQSEEAQTSEEWRILLDRCVRARRADMLDAIRSIVHGAPPDASSVDAIQSIAHGTPQDASSEHAKHDIFVREARQRWKELVENPHVENQARMPHGHYEFSFEILGVDPIPTLEELHERLKKADEIRHTGWGPFRYADRDTFRPYPFNEQLIEAWLGNPKGDWPGRTSATCDFWRVHPDGRMFLQRGYEEDCDEVFAGKSFFREQPIRSVAEVMLYVARFSRLYGSNNPTIVTKCLYSGLQGRELKDFRHQRIMRGPWACGEYRKKLEIRATVEEIEDNLEEIVDTLLRPLYELFSRYKLEKHMVSRVIKELKRHRV